MFGNTRRTAAVVVGLTVYATAMGLLNEYSVWTTFGAFAVAFVVIGLWTAFMPNRWINSLRRKWGDLSDTQENNHD
jgi:hypothetical protein